MTLADIKGIDKSGMYDLIKGFPGHFAEGRKIGALADPIVRVNEINQVVIAGMGGSAIGGDLLRAYAGPDSNVPISVVRTYQLPASVTKDTLLVASSYSGNTEETLSLVTEALSRGTHIFCITTGGQLLDIAQRENLPHVVVPGGMPPRAALAYSLTPLLYMARAAGIIGVSDAELDEAQLMLDNLCENYCNPENGNEALNIAEILHGNLPVIYSGTGLLETVNLRWRGQINENAKVHAYGNLYPELNHNEIMGWEGNGWLTSKMAVVTLQDSDDHPRIRRRMEITKGILAKEAAQWIELKTQGEGRLARMLSLLHLGDWVSLYLAMLNNADPTPIAGIDALKSALS